VTPDSPVTVPGAAPSIAPPLIGVAPSPTPPPGYLPPAAPRPPAAFDSGVEALLRWAGVVLISLAGIFLVSTAISRGWIGPELQLLAAALGGAAMSAAAVYIADARRPWARALGCGGAVVLAVAALATHEWLDLVGPVPALVFVAAATAASVGVALRLRLESIALVAGLVALVAPLDTLRTVGDSATLAWIAAYIGGSSLLGLVMSWPGLRIIVGWLGALFLMIYALTEDIAGALQVVGFIGTAVIAASLWAGPSVLHRLPKGATTRSGSQETFDWKPIDNRMVAFVPAWVWIVATGLLSPAHDQTAGLIAIVTAVGFALLVVATWSYVPHLISTTMAFGALTVLALGFAIYLDGPALMVALGGQAITSYYVSRQLNARRLRLHAYGVSLVSSAMAVFEMVDAIDRDGFANLGYLVATLLVVLGWVAAAVLSHLRGLTSRELDGNDATAVAASGTRYPTPFQLSFIGAWAGTTLWVAAALLAAPQGLVLISAAWATMACIGLIVGLIQRISVMKNVALATLSITLCKLVTIDMAEVDVFWRVGLFFVVGMAMITLGLKIPALMKPTSATTPDSEPGDDGPAAGQLTTF
jgi:hypothetical protein